MHWNFINAAHRFIKALIWKAQQVQQMNMYELHYDICEDFSMNENGHAGKSKKRGIN